MFLALSPARQSVLESVLSQALLTIHPSSPEHATLLNLLLAVQRESLTGPLPILPTDLGVLPVSPVLPRSN